MHPRYRIGFLYIYSLGVLHPGRPNEPSSEGWFHQTLCVRLAAPIDVILFYPDGFFSQIVVFSSWPLFPSPHFFFSSVSVVRTRVSGWENAAARAGERPAASARCARLRRGRRLESAASVVGRLNRRQWRHGESRVAGDAAGGLRPMARRFIGGLSFCTRLFRSRE